ncbi:MAG: hypothetical protein V1866_04535 [archaeon]
MKGFMFSRKANVFAAMFVIMIILAAVGVITYTKFIQKEENIDYNSIISEAYNAFERIFYSSTYALSQQGLSVTSGLWYCDAAPHPPSFDEIESSLNSMITSKLIQMEWNQKKGSYTVNVTTPVIDVDLSDPSNPKLNMSNLSIIVSSDGELRILSFSDGSQFLDGSSYAFISPVLDWLRCDAGRLTKRLEDINKDKVCKLYSCCCKKASSLNTLYDQLHVGDITYDEVYGVVDDSVAVLNQLFAGAQSCGGTGNLQAAEISCRVDYGGSLFNVLNDIFLDTTPNDCGDEASGCKVNLQAGGSLSEWNDGITAPSGGCPTTRPPLDGMTVSVDLDVDPGDPPYRAPDNYEEERYENKRFYFRAAMHRKAAGNVRIVCAYKDNPSKSFSFRIRFNVRYNCQFPTQSVTPEPPTPCSVPGPTACDSDEDCGERNCHKIVCDIPNRRCTQQMGSALPDGSRCGDRECGATCQSGACTTFGGICSVSCGSYHQSASCSSDGDCPLRLPGECCHNTWLCSSGQDCCSTGCMARTTPKCGGGVG